MVILLNLQKLSDRHKIGVSLHSIFLAINLGNFPKKRGIYSDKAQGGRLIQLQSRSRE